jgi:hypothetical protein
MTLNSAVAVPKGSDNLGKYTFDSPPDFTFSATNERGEDLMDLTFDPITTPGNEDMLAAMQAIQSPNWLGNMLVLGSVDGSPSLLSWCATVRSLAGQAYPYITTDFFGLWRSRWRIMAAP